jgi:hypothetical protein
MTQGLGGSTAAQPADPRSFSEGFDAGRRTLRSFRRRPPILALAWVALVAIGMAPLGRRVFLHFFPSPSVWWDGGRLLAVTLLTLVVASLVGTVGVDATVRRPQSCQRRWGSPLGRWACTSPR